MKKLILSLTIFIPSLFFSQTSRDINTIIQKTIDLQALNKHFSDGEKTGKTPLIIINDDKIPNNLIVFKFNKQVKIMSSEQLETFNSISKKNLDSFFVFEIIEFKGETVKIQATFRKSVKIAISIHMEKQGKGWIVTESFIT